MTATVVTVAGARYPYLPTCPCGEQFRGYAAAHAATIVADAHECRTNTAAVLGAANCSVVPLPDGPLVKVWGSWSAETARRAEGIDPSVDRAAWRAAMGSHEEATLTADGRMVDRSRWCRCEGETPTPVRYEFWTTRGREAHGWACASCRGITQTG